MKLQLALAAAIAQASAGHADAVFPTGGEHVTYAIHDTLPRGDAYDATLTLSQSSAATILISSPREGSANVPLDGGAPARMNRSLGMGFHLLEVANGVVQAGLSGSETATIPIGPPGSEPSALHVTRSGNTFTASGTVSLPPPPMGGPAGPVHALNIRIVATTANGKLVSARGALAPVDGRGPHDAWTIERK